MMRRKTIVSVLYIFIVACCRCRWIVALAPCTNTLQYNHHQGLFMTTTTITTPNEDATTQSSSSAFRVLALHGSGETTDSFLKQLQPWREALHWEDENCIITAIPAPFPKEDTNGYCWWTMPPGVRSYNADTYDGFDVSAQRVREAFFPQKKKEQVDKEHRFDVIIAHSQGAIFITALLALGLLPTHLCSKIILNGVAWPNPYTQQLEQLPNSSSSSSIWGNNKDHAAPSFLFLMGETDTINPTADAVRIADIMERAGANVQRCWHPNGHSIPTQDPNVLQIVQEFLGGE